jgi:hypothetical protein
MIAGVISLPRSALDDDTFRAPILSGALWFYVVLSIPSTREPPLTILKRPAADITGRRMVASILNRL